VEDNSKPLRKAKVSSANLISLSSPIAAAREKTASLEQSINDYASGERAAAMGEESEIKLALETFAFLSGLELSST